MNNPTHVFEKEKDSAAKGLRELQIVWVTESQLQLITVNIVFNLGDPEHLFCNNLLCRSTVPKRGDTEV